MISAVYIIFSPMPQIKNEKLENFLKQLKKFGKQNNIPNISEKNAEYLKTLIQSRGVKNILEIGTANGYSSIQFASVMSEIWGSITTIEFSQLAFEMAQENIEASWLSSYIIQYYGDAREIIPHLDWDYDMIFIDGLKKASLQFYQLAQEKLQPWGIIIIDDVIKFRHKMEELYTYLKENNIPYKLEQIDEDDGIMILEQ